MKVNDFVVMPLVVEQRQGGGKRRMTAEVYLDCWCKPSDLVLRTPIEIKSGFCQVVLLGDLLQECIVRPRIQGANSSRVAGKNFVGKGINLLDL